MRSILTAECSMTTSLSQRNLRIVLTPLPWLSEGQYNMRCTRTLSKVAIGLACLDLSDS